jgi:hypothetical protein
MAGCLRNDARLASRSDCGRKSIVSNTWNVNDALRSEGRNLSTAPEIAASPMCGAYTSPSSGSQIARQAASICGQAVIGCPCRVRSVPVAMCQYARTPLTLGCTYRLPDGKDSTVIYWQSIGVVCLRFTASIVAEARQIGTRITSLYFTHKQDAGTVYLKAGEAMFDPRRESPAGAWCGAVGLGMAPRLGTLKATGRGGGCVHFDTFVIVSK